MIHIPKNATPDDPTLASPLRVAYPVMRTIDVRTRNRDGKPGYYSTIRRGSTKISDTGPKILPTPGLGDSEHGAN
jgi:hypothetical protein